MNAQFAALLCLLLALACALCALATWRHSKLVMLRHTTSSFRVELDAMHDAIEKHSQLLKRINARSVMAERRANGHDVAASGSESSDAAALSHKDRLRKMAGLTAGKPAAHS